MHHARLSKSERLQKVLWALSQGPQTTRALIRMTGCCAINSVIAELRANGQPIAPAKCIRPGVYEYRLEVGK